MNALIVYKIKRNIKKIEDFKEFRELLALSDLVKTSNMISSFEKIIL